MHGARRQFPASSGSCAGFAQGVLWLLLFLLSGVVSVMPLAQQSDGQPPISGPGGTRSHTPFDPFGDSDPAIPAKQLRALNDQRQKTMVSDADKLLVLARELNTEVEAAQSDSMTPAQLRKIADIEKLAREIKQKMLLSLGPGPQFHQPGSTSIP